MVVTKCFVVTGGGRYKAGIVVLVVFVVKPGAYVARVWVEACTYYVDACVESTDDMDLNGLISPPSDAIGPFLVIVDI